MRLEPLAALSAALMATAAALITLHRPAAAASPVLPALTAEDLNGRAMRLPDDLPAARTLLLLGFEREDQDFIDTWVNGLQLAGRADWLEMPVIDNPGALGRWFVQTGMRRGVPEPDGRAHVVSVYTDKAAFLASLGMPGVSAVQAVVVDKSGMVLARESGSFGVDKAQRLRAAWGG